MPSRKPTHSTPEPGRGPEAEPEASDERRGPGSSRRGGAAAELSPEELEALYAETQAGRLPGAAGERTEVKASPFVEKKGSANDTEPPSSHTRLEPAPSRDERYSTGTEYPARTRSKAGARQDKAGAGQEGKEGKPDQAPPGRPGEEPTDYATGSAYGNSTLAAPEDADEPEGEEEDDASTPDTADLEPEGDDDPYGEKDYPSEDQEYVPGPKPKPRAAPVDRRTETRIAPLDDFDSPSADDENATRTGPPIKLKIVAGPDAGQTKRVNGVRMVIGRGSGCELKLSDQSISRRHIELVQGKDGVLLRDLDSGNGTKVNGVKVHEKLLEHDDEIAIGKTRFRFVDEVAAFRKLRDDAEKKEESQSQAPPGDVPTGKLPTTPPVEGPSVVVDPSAMVASKDEVDADEAALRAETQAGMPVVKAPPRPGPRARAQSPWQRLDPKRRTQVKLGATAAGALVVIAIVLAVRKPGPPPEDPRMAPALVRMQAARAAIRAERYDEAVAAIAEAEKTFPGIDTERLGERAAQELAAQKAADAVRALIEQDRFEDARAQLATLPTSTLKRDDEKKKLEAALTEREITYKLRKAGELLEAKDLDAARQVLDTLPPERQRELQAQVEQVEAEVKAEKRVEALRGAARAAAAKKAREAAREAELQRAFAAVARKFHGGEYLRAAAECDRVVDENPGDPDVRERSKRLRTLIPNFGRNFEEGHKKYKSGQLASSVKPLRRARDLYQQIGFEGALGQQIDEELAGAALAAGRDAMAHGDLASAALNFRDAANLDPSDSRARAGLDQVGARAEDLFTEAYMVRDRDPREAIAKFKLVLEVTQPTSTTHQRAKSQLAALQPDKQ